MKPINEMNTKLIIVNESESKKSGTVNIWDMLWHYCGKDKVFFPLVI